MKQAIIVIFLAALAILFGVGCNNSPIPDDSASEAPESSVPSEKPEDEGNGFPLSQRTPVSGILVESELSWSSVSVIDRDGAAYPLSHEDAQEVYRILSTMEAEEVPNPFHYEGQFSSPMFTIFIEYDGDSDISETIYSTETGLYYFRFMDTVGSHGDTGFVGGFNEALNVILSAYIPPAWEIFVSVDYATDELLGKYDSFEEFVEFEDEGYQRIIITTDIAVKDFKFIEVGYSSDSTGLRFFEKDVLFSLDELLPEKPFVVTWMEWGTMPHRGISFVDENNTTRYFCITMSGKDGSLLLVEIL